MSPLGELAAVHQDQPMIHHLIPPFHLHSTVLNNPDYNNNLGIFQVDPTQEVDDDPYASLIDPSSPATLPPPPLPSQQSQLPSSTSGTSLHSMMSMRSNSMDDDNENLKIQPLVVNIGSVRLNHVDNEYDMHEEQALNGEGPVRKEVIKRIEVVKTFDNSYIEWTEEDERQWKSQGGSTANKSRLNNNTQSSKLTKGDRCLHAVELAARALGHGSAEAMRLFLQHSSITAEVCVRF
jgi:hypothetical protein